MKRRRIVKSNKIQPGVVIEMERPVSANELAGALELYTS